MVQATGDRILRRREVKIKVHKRSREEFEGVSSGIGCLKKNGCKTNMKAVLTLESTEKIVS